MCPQCYLYPDEPLASNTQLGTDSAASNADGTTIVAHRSDRLCFPMIPFVPNRIPTFRELTNTEGVDFNELSYTNSCHTETIVRGMELLKEAGVDLTSPFAPVALVLRSGEAIDAVRNFAATGGADTGMEAAGALLCGVMQLGGILYLALLLPALSFILICATPLTACAMCCIRCCLVGAANRKSGQSTRVLQRRGWSGDPPARAEEVVPLVAGLEAPATAKALPLREDAALPSALPLLTSPSRKLRFVLPAATAAPAAAAAPAEEAWECEALASGGKRF